MGKKPKDRTNFKDQTIFKEALKSMPETVPLHLAFQSACGQVNGKVGLHNEGLSCTLPSGARIKGPGIEGPG